MSNSINNDYHISALFQAWCSCRVAPHLHKYFAKLSLIFTLVRNALKSFGFLVADPCKMNFSPHPRRTLPWLLMKSCWYESAEKIKFCFAAIWSRNWRQMPPNIGGKLFKVWKSTFQSWINIEPFGYCFSTSLSSIIKCYIDALLDFAKKPSWVSKQCRTEDKG